MQESVQKKEGHIQATKRELVGKAEREGNKRRVRKEGQRGTGRRDR